MVATDTDTVLVAGAGTAGAAAALLLAAKGVRVVLADARRRDRVGASWINGVEAPLFRELDLPEPPDDVVFFHGRRFLLQDPTGAARAIVDDPPQQEVDMRALNAWLIDECERAGVELRFGAKVAIGEAGPDGRVASVRGREQTFAAIVDASGLTAQLAATFDAPRDLCSAWQGVYEVKHTGQARDALGRYGARDGDIVSIAGIEGGYSVMNLMLLPDAERVAILTGAMHRDELRSGARIASDFVRSQPWIGRRLLGGGGLIPLRPTEHAPVDDRLLRIGNAAGHVFPQHGSGVAVGMRAAWHAAQAISAGLQLGALDAKSLWPAVVAFQRGSGAMCAHYQPLRYVSQTFTPADARTLIDAGVLSGTSVRRALAQQSMGADPVSLLGSVLHARRLAPLVPRMAAAGLLAAEITRHWRRFPERGAGPDYDRWAAWAEKLLDRARALADLAPVERSA